MTILEDIKQELIKIHTSTHYVVYFDILGAKELINSKDSELYLNYINSLYNDTIKGLKSLYAEINNVEIKFKIFSDNIIIAIPKTEGANSAKESIKRDLIVEIAAYFQVLAYKYSLLTRGSVVIGDLYLDNNFVYGKALTRAYELESKVAIYPRIVVDEKYSDIFKMSQYIRKFIYKDSDGVEYLNSFECYFDIAKIYKEDEIKHIRQILWSKLKDSNPTVVNQKIFWLINIFNQFCLNNDLEKYVLDVDKLPKFIDIFNKFFENAEKIES
ncbi:MAG: hypothetical protein ACLSWI_08535 [Candidatus Gastranaerophilaceae bacterium]